MANVKDVANYFVIRSHDEQGEDADITPLKLQKLCYYAQGIYLATKNKKLFKDDILAWEHGPVVKALHSEYGGRGAQVIAKPELTLDDLELNFEEKQTLSDVYSYFGQFSAWKLRNMTHQETPWINTASNCVIELELIKKYFKDNIIA